MIFFRRRLLYWLLKEYIKKWGRTMVLFFVVGLIAFFSFGTVLRKVHIPIVSSHRQTIGIVGAFTLDSLPPVVLKDLSKGLTKIDSSGQPLPDAAESWYIKENGKVYVVKLREHVFFSDGAEFTSDDITYNFSDASLQKVGKYTVVFTLKETYSPFLVTISRPLFRKRFSGLSDYTIKNVELNGDFVKTLTLLSKTNKRTIKRYIFYPSSESLRIAFALGEIDKAIGADSTNLHNASFTQFSNTHIERKINYTQLVTLFFNTRDQFLSSRDTRAGLIYALPDTFPQGERAYSFLPPTSWAYNSQQLYVNDKEHAKLLLKDFLTASSSAIPLLEIKTLQKYESVADIVQKAWKEAGVNSKIVIVDSVPDRFQIFLGDFFLPKDPDQYMLWHSGQENNITFYENKRIDKLLEDGRKTILYEERKKIYTDLQKYLMADAPAAFLYFPVEYDITRQ